MKSVPPIPSVAQTGPLGVVQMPRLWCKLLLDAKGQLAEGYWPSGQGFDKRMLEGIGVNQEAATAYVQESRPTYAQFEAWILAQKGGALPPETVQQVNASILGFTPKEERLRAFKEELGLDPAFPTTDYHWLIEMDDWKQFHTCLMADGEGVSRVIPFAVEARGPIGAVQLPRLWSKVLLDARGLLAEGYHPCGNGLDRVVLEGLSLSRDAALDFLTHHLPTYLEFERWIVAQRGPVTEDEVGRVNAQILGHVAHRRDAILEAAGMDPNLNETRAFVLNRYDDWVEFHKIAVGA